MAWYDIFKPQRKFSDARRVATIGKWGSPQSMPRNYQSFADEAYRKNIIAFKCIQAVAKACGQTSLYVTQGERELDNHPVLKLFKRPNPMQGQASLFENMVGYFLISGNSYLESVRPTPKAPPVELWPVRPDRMKIVPGQFGLPQQFIYTAESGVKTWEVDPINGKSDLLHVKTFNPTNDWYGMSPIEAAVYAIDQHSETMKWNAHLLKNSAVPSGMIRIPSTESNPTGTVTEEQFQILKQEIDAQYSGSVSAGKPMLLEGGLEWTQLSLSPKDMDWIQGKHTSSRDIALAFGVPPILLNIPGDSTFANYKEARLAFYEDQIIPLMEFLLDELNVWLMPMFDKSGAELKLDVDSITALHERRLTLYDIAAKSTWLTVNEKRVMTGFEGLPGWDVIQVGIDLINNPEDMEPEPEPEPTPEPLQETEQEQSPEDNEELDEGDEKHTIEYIMSERKGIRVFNNVSRNEKRRLQRQQDAIRQRIETAFEMDMSDALDAQAGAVAKAVSTTSPALAEFAMLRAIEDTMPDVEAVVRKYLARTAKIFGDATVNDAKSQGLIMETKSAETRYDEAMNEYIDRHTAEAITPIKGTTIKKAREKIKQALRDNLEEGGNNQQLANSIREDLESLTKSRARMIARTETGAAASQSLIESVRSLQVPGMQKEWVATIDERTRDTHAQVDGTRVAIDEQFQIGDYSTDRPQGEGLPPEDLIQCRCTMTFIREA
jgi:HK97 family phage portal protein